MYSIAFFIEQSGAMDSVSLFLYYTPEGSPYHEENAGKFGEQFEKIHMLLFMVMIIFVLNIIVLCRSAGQIEDKWNEWEMLCHDPERMALFCEDLEAREHDRGGSLRTKTKRLGYTYKTMDEILDYMVRTPPTRGHHAEPLELPLLPPLSFQNGTTHYIARCCDL